MWLLLLLTLTPAFLFIVMVINTIKEYEEWVEQQLKDKEELLKCIREMRKNLENVDEEDSNEI